MPASFPATSLLLDGTGLRSLALARYVESWRGSQPMTILLGPEAWQRIAAAADLVSNLAGSSAPIYSVTTGVGDLARVQIAPENSAILQRKILRSHSAAWGEPLSTDIVRTAMLVRLNTWAKGHSGLRPETVQLYLDLLNHGVVPVVLEKGSLGASGDLAPLAMLSLVLIGEGEAFYQGERLPAKEAMRRAGLAPVELTYKEALALINGTTLMAGEGALLLQSTRSLYGTALRAYALAVEALCGKTAPYAARVQDARPHPGQGMVAAQLRWALRGSSFVNRQNSMVQDAYSLRCIPQIAGPSFETLNNAERTLEIELNSASDNPLFWPELTERGADACCVGAGNFHGQTLAMAFDFLAIATAEMASLAERLTNRLVNPHLSGLPPFLAAPGGLDSGLMIAHYAQASLVSECRTLCHPATVDNISTSADQEDHVNMGPVALRKYRTILANTQGVIAILLLCAAQAVDLRRVQLENAVLPGGSSNPPSGTPARTLMLGAGTQPVYVALRAVVPFMNEDRVLYPEIELLTKMLRAGDF